MQVDATEGTCAGDVEEPRVDAGGVEGVVAGEDADVLAKFEVVGADGAGVVIVWYDVLGLSWRWNGGGRDFVCIVFGAWYSSCSCII